MSKKIFLFDMDGTLTEPRKEIDFNMVRKLKKLSSLGDIGIVTGSDFEYVNQQCNFLFDLGGVDLNKLLLFPCNGTKKYVWEGSSFKKKHDADMIEKISKEAYHYILQTTLSYQLMICVQHKLPFTGTFFHYRGSMLNWCPIGRQADSASRSAWVSVDKEKKIREYFLHKLKEDFTSKKYNVEVALGGSTSFDIYPEGWDKTYVIDHLGDYEEIYFVGDKCRDGGNDKALYDILHEEGKSFETSGPEETLEIIDVLIEKNI